jgi:hypothetical protein
MSWAQARATPPRETSLYIDVFKRCFLIPKVLAPETPIERLLKHLSKCEPAPFGGHYYFAQRSTDCTDCQEIGG